MTLKDGTAVALTSRWIAAARAYESARRDRLFDDPYAAALAGVGGLDTQNRLTDSSVKATLLDSLILRALRTFGSPYLAIRTRYFDDLLLHATHTAEVRQVVILAAGMDTRAFRLTWPSGLSLYEIDRPAVLAAKEKVLQTAGAQASCRRYTLGIDLTDSSWPRTLCESGFDAQRPSVWLIEGLFMYLNASEVHTLLRAVTTLTTPDSWLGADLVNAAFFTSLFLRPWLRVAVTHGAPWRFGTDMPETLFAEHGWDARVTQPGEAGAHYQRWPLRVFPRMLTRVPRIFLVAAQRRHATNV